MSKTGVFFRSLGVSLVLTIFGSVILALINNNNPWEALGAGLALGLFFGTIYAIAAVITFHRKQPKATNSHPLSEESGQVLIKNGKSKSKMIRFALCAAISLISGFCVRTERNEYNDGTTLFFQGLVSGLIISFLVLFVLPWLFRFLWKFLLDRVAEFSKACRGER
jgi:4-amino-4-deoxy-L-arabinose transferase-like glycosyltransferase